MLQSHSNIDNQSTTVFDLPPSSNTQRYLELLHPDGACFEIRMLGVSKYTPVLSGYYTDSSKAAADVQEQLANCSPTGCYVTLNPVNPVCTGRADHRLDKAKRENTTNDDEIIKRTAILIDIDPVTPVSGVNASDDERDEAKKALQRIYAFLSEKSFPDPMTVSTGNGYALVYRVDLSNSDVSTKLVERFLKSLKQRFGSETAKIDTSVSNSSRITKLPGTIARKADATEDRPQRNVVFKAPETLEVVPAAALEEVAEHLPLPSADASAAPSSANAVENAKARVETFCSEVGLKISSPSPWKDGGAIYICESLPKPCEDHYQQHGCDRKQYICILNNGAISAGCQHDGCEWNSWKSLQAAYGFDKPQSIATLFGQTDVASADRFSDFADGQLKFVSAWNRWFFYDGRRWHDDAGVGAQRLAKRYAEHLQTEFWKLSHEERDKARDYVARSANRAGINNMLSLAASDELIAVDYRKLDNHPGLFNVLNGTLNLDTRELIPHTPEHLITQIATVAYDPAQDCQQWEKTIDLALGHDANLTQYFQQLCGYVLCGESSEAILPILHGSGCNGKSTVTNAIQKLMGDYATTVSKDVLLGGKDQHPTALADLHKKRFVCVSEPERGERLNESLIKQLTGNDKIKARRMREDHWEFDPTHAIWMPTNHMPAIQGTDEGIWRRVKLIPFNVNLKEKITIVPGFQERLFEEEACGILNWMLDGYSSWKQNGFIEPAAVEVATQDYRNNEDVLQLWIDDHCDIDSSLQCPGLMLFEHYQKTGGRLGPKKFGAEMKSRFQHEQHSSGEFRGRIVYTGIRPCIRDFDSQMS